MGSVFIGEGDGGRVKMKRVGGMEKPVALTIVSRIILTTKCLSYMTVV